MLTQRSRAHMIRCKFREVGDDLRGGHPRGKVLEHVVNRDPRRDEAGLASTHARPHIDQRHQIAIDLVTDEVLADAATMLEIIETVRSRELKASIVRAPREDEPVLVGLG